MKREDLAILSALRGGGCQDIVFNFDDYISCEELPPKVAAALVGIQAHRSDFEAVLRWLYGL